MGYSKRQSCLEKNKIQAICLILIIALVAVVLPHSAYAAYSFAAPQNLSNVGTVVTSQVAVSGNNVYVVWEDNGAADIFFAKSTNNGATFGAPVDISNDAFSSSPKIMASGSNIYVVWRDTHGGAANDIFFIKSSNNGTTFGSPINISNNAGESTNQQIAVSGSNVYVTWQDLTPGNNEIFFAKSTNSGTSFSAATNLSNNAGASIFPQIAASGSNVYITWEDLTPGNADTFFIKSSDSGTTFGSKVNLSNNAGASITPQIAASGTSVYVTWDDFTPGNDEIFFSKSTDGGATFNGASLGNPPGAPINLSNTSTESKSPQIAVSGSNVYLVWQEKLTSTNKDVLFIKSTDGGATFGPQVNLSSNSGNSITPVIAVLGSNLGVAWVDNTPGNNDIFFKSSSDGGSTFSSVVNLSNTPGDSTFPALVLSTTKAYVTWADENTSPGSFAYDAFFTSGAPSSTNIVFDASEYKLSSTAGISITAPSSNNPLKLDSILVNIKSTSDTTGITANFSETGINTGVFTKSITFSDTSASSGTTLHALPGDTITASFGGTSSTANIFRRTVSFDLSSYTPGSKAIITVIDQNSNLNPASAETIPVLVTSTHNSQGVTVSLLETGPDTGFFNSTSSFTLNVASYDTITATYKGATATASIVPGTSPGGGGGGLLRPGLVLDAILGYANGGSLGQILPPSFSKTGIPEYNPSPLKPMESTVDTNAPFSIDDKSYDIFSYTNTVTTNTKETGSPIDIKFVIYDGRSLDHVALYANLRGDKRDVSSADTSIINEEGQPLAISDPNHIFSKVSFGNDKNDTKNEIHFRITFAKPMDKSDLILRVWDSDRHNMDTIVRDALEVVPSAQTTSPTTSPTTSAPTNAKPVFSFSSSTVPLSKTTTGSTVQPANDVTDEIKMWGGYSPKSISDSELLGDLGMHGNHIPNWLMKSTKLFVNGDVSQDEFLNILKYMDKQGFLK
jgi:hypothetical protein